MPELADEFVPSGSDEWPLTPRTRFVLWRALCAVPDSLDANLADVRDGDEQIGEVAERSISVLNQFPVLTRRQPLEWWEQVCSAAERVTEAARTGGPALVPRTPAEEAVLYIAAERGWPDAVFDSLDTGDFEDLRAQFEALDERDDDFEWGEVLPALTGDADIEQLWMHQIDGIGDPDDEINQMMGIGDYRPQSWHRLFDRRVRELDAEKGLDE